MDSSCISRRQFMKVAGTAAAGLALGCCGALPSDAAVDDRPNISFMIADD